MKKYLAIYLGTNDSPDRKAWQSLDDATRKAREAAGVKSWMDWGTRHQGVIRDMGGPLGKTKRASRDGVADVRNEMTGYVILEAESHAAAARLFEEHPHFAIFPGVAVDIMEILPIPGP